MTESSTRFRAEELLPGVLELARRAGAAILEIYQQADPKAESKADGSPLTEADLVSHAIIVEGLGHLTPEWPVLSEESQEVSFDRRRPWRVFWMVDPLDGTKEFLHRSGEFTVNIALIEEGRPVLGVVYAPAIDLLYYAAKGAGAWRVQNTTTSPIRVSPPPNGNLRMVISRSHSSGEEHLSRFTGGAERCELVPMGSSLKFCLVAEGSADVYPRLGPTMEWDVAAAHCIVEEAGGTVADLDGNPMGYNKPVLKQPGFVAQGARGAGHRSFEARPRPGAEN